MKLILNGQDTEINGIRTVGDLLARLEKNPSIIAVAVNLDFVPRTDYNTTELKEADAVEIVSPHPGG